MAGRDKVLGLVNCWSWASVPLDLCVITLRSKLSNFADMSNYVLFHPNEVKLIT